MVVVVVMMMKRRRLWMMTGRIWNGNRETDASDGMTRGTWGTRAPRAEFAQMAPRRRQPQDGARSAAARNGTGATHKGLAADNAAGVARSGREARNHDGRRGG